MGWTPELVIAIIAAVTSPFVTIIGLYFKHAADMAEYRTVKRDLATEKTLLAGKLAQSQQAVLSEVRSVEATLTNGIKSIGLDSNVRLKELRNELTDIPEGAPPQVKD